jgi:hypothetical protein
MSESIESLMADSLVLNAGITLLSTLSDIDRATQKSRTEHEIGLLISANQQRMADFLFWNFMKSSRRYQCGQ